MQFDQTAQRFQAQINAIAGVANMTGEQVYELWCRYDRQCTMYDQSPVLFEFIRWYADQLGGNQSALQQALDDEREFQANQDDQEAAYEDAVQRSYQARGQACLY